MESRRLIVPEGWSLQSLQSSLGDRLENRPVEEVLVTHLDTFDWRLHRAGCRLTEEATDGSRTLVLRTPDDRSPYVAPVDGEARFAWDLPAGHLQTVLTPILEVRSLLPVAADRISRRQYRVVDREGNTAVRLWVEEVAVLDEDGNSAADPRDAIRVQGFPGHEDAFRSLLDDLESLGASRSEVDDLARSAAARGRTPGDYSSKIRIKLSAQQSANEAVRVILLQLLATLRANIDGVLNDLDVEFLHDMRVATRRTRSALTQIKGVLPQEGLDVFAPEFKWLGNLTGPCRDFDVYLVELKDHRRHLGSAGSHLDPLQRMLEGERKQAHRQVCSGLRSSRFQRLVDGWGEFLTAPPRSDPEPPNARRSVARLADERILKAYNRIVRRGSKLTDDPPAETMHRIRIDAKKLRYLLEFFASLYPKMKIDDLVRELKRFQDILGGFNDMQVQRVRLAEFANLLNQAGDTPMETLLAMGRLAAEMERRQEEHRHAFAERFAEFADRSSRRRYEELFAKER
jgi:CHAD domain-containing protein